MRQTRIKLVHVHCFIVTKVVLIDRTASLQRVENMALLPTALVGSMRILKDKVHQEIYVAACSIVMQLDEADLLNDQMIVDADEWGVLTFQWTFYNLYCTIESRYDPCA